MICVNCNKETSNPKFCSRSCSNSYNNTLFPKREKESTCILCRVAIHSPRKYCSDCWKSITSEENKTKRTLLECQNLRKYQVNSDIRSRARRAYEKSGKQKQCFVCGYSAHYEVCHIVSISSFSCAATISEINSLDNLVALCPNHHWELDNGLLKL